MPPTTFGRSMCPTPIWKVLAEEGAPPVLILPGQAVEIAFAEGFNARLRDECLNSNWFVSVRHAKEIIESLRQDYNKFKPHSSLKGRTPREFAGSMTGLYQPVMLILG